MRRLRRTRRSAPSSIRRPSCGPSPSEPIRRPPISALCATSRRAGRGGRNFRAWYPAMRERSRRRRRKQAPSATSRTRSRPLFPSLGRSGAFLRRTRTGFRTSMPAGVGAASVVGARPATSPQTVRHLLLLQPCIPYRWLHPPRRTLLRLQACSPSSRHSRTTSTTSTGRARAVPRSHPRHKHTRPLRRTRALPPSSALRRRRWRGRSVLPPVARSATRSALSPRLDVRLCRNNPTSRRTRCRFLEPCLPCRRRDARSIVSVARTSACTLVHRLSRV